jgi:iron(III) transport system ATP-binding protein
MTAPALTFTDIAHDYDGTVSLRGVSFSLRAGEVLCLLGPSGCGKSTVLRLAAGLETPSRGRIDLVGRLVAGEGAWVPPEEREVGLLFQDFALFPHLTVADNVGFGLRGRPAAERDRLIAEALERTRMTDRIDAYPHSLSGGEQQRIALARALAPRPKVLMLDEPFSGLDSRLRQQIRDDTLHVLKDVRASVILVTHDPEEALFMGDRIALMKDGEIAQIGDAAALYFNPVSAFAAEFFGEVNRVAAKVAGGHVQTPFGTLPAPNLADGTEVVCLLRSEALRIPGATDRADANAVVEMAHLLGRSTLVHLRTQGSAGEPLHLHARIPATAPIRPGDGVRVELDPRLCHVFPAT